jgi:hypothetical protein
MKNQEQPKLRLLLTKWSANGCRDDEKPELLIDAADYPRAARQIRELLASEPCIVERGTPMKVMKTEEGPRSTQTLRPERRSWSGSRRRTPRARSAPVFGERLVHVGLPSRSPAR